jgi:glucan phosphoethanolaminetransferase (alkaline phosphatase superfamily)
MYVGLMDKTSERRLECNRYFISLNSLLVSIIGIINFIGVFLNIQIVWLIFTIFFGVVLNVVWISLLNSYKNLNDARFHIIHLIEERLPISPFHQEWEYVENEQEEKYSLLSQKEKNIPWMFIGLYIILIVLGFYQLCLL